LNFCFFLALKGQNQESVTEFNDFMDFHQSIYKNLFYVVTSLFMRCQYLLHSNICFGRSEARDRGLMLSPKRRVLNVNIIQRIKSINSIYLDVIQHRQNCTERCYRNLQFTIRDSALQTCKECEPNLFSLTCLLQLHSFCGRGTEFRTRKASF
jgi:hypothetical protein